MTRLKHRSHSLISQSAFYILSKQDKKCYHHQIIISKSAFLETVLFSFSGPVILYMYDEHGVILLSLGQIASNHNNP